MYRLQSLRESVPVRSHIGDGFPCAHRPEQVYWLRRVQGKVPEEGDCVDEKKTLLVFSVNVEDR